MPHRAASAAPTSLPLPVTPPARLFAGEHERGDARTANNLCGSYPQPSAPDVPVYRTGALLTAQVFETVGKGGHNESVSYCLTLGEAVYTLARAATG